MLKSEMNGLIAHEETGLRTELVTVLRKREMHVPLSLFPTLVGSCIHQACWLLHLWACSPMVGRGTGTATLS